LIGWENDRWSEGCTAETSVEKSANYSNCTGHQKTQRLYTEWQVDERAIIKVNGVDRTQNFKCRRLLAWFNVKIDLYKWQSFYEVALILE